MKSCKNINLNGHNRFFIMSSFSSKNKKIENEILYVMRNVHESINHNTSMVISYKCLKVFFNFKVLRNTPFYCQSTNFTALKICIIRVLILNPVNPLVMMHMPLNCHQLVSINLIWCQDSSSKWAFKKPRSRFL